VYDSDTSTYLDVDRQRIETAKSGEPPDNCPVCLLVEQRNHGSFWSRIRGGISYLGKAYHVHDFVLIRTTSGPCEIGQISDIRLQERFHRHDSPKIFAKLFGRIGNLDIRPDHVVKDEVSIHFSAFTADSYLVLATFVLNGRGGADQKRGSRPCLLRLPSPLPWR
jgi:DNA (cytosine-5)-methyltransferase 1